MKEIFMLRARWRELETEPRTRLTGTKGATPDTAKPGPDGPPRQFPTLRVSSEGWHVQWEIVPPG